MKTIITQPTSFNAFLEANPMLPITGGTYSDIDEDGNLHIYLLYNNPRPEEIKCFQTQTPSLYYYELRDMSALLLDFCGMTEVTINPSYYTDGRYEKLLTKPELLVHCTLVDPIKRTALMSKTFTVSNKQRKVINKGLELNNKHNRLEFTTWISTVLYSRTAKDNIRLSQYLGRLYESRDTEINVIFI